MVASHSSDSQQLNKGIYRPEIDGMRGFAVVAVIINHINSSVLPGGYLGVDIFFVISGFVITASLATKQARSLADFLLGFYGRRIKRLLPALLLCIGVTSLLLCLVDPNPGLRLGVAWRALFGFSNITLYNLATDYFSSATEINPFTHTWSLGVEEQFYLLFPFLVWWSGHNGRLASGSSRLAAVIGILSALSFISYLHQSSVNPQAAFFLIQNRFWEIGLGCLLYLHLARQKASPQADPNAGPAPGPVQGPKPAKALASIAILLAMVGTLLVRLPQPWLATPLMVLLTAMLIGSLRPRTPCYRLLTLKPVIGVGLMSYSLYLWHWSVLSLSRWTVGLHWWSIPPQLVLIVILAWLSYRFVEQPLRRARWSGVGWHTIAYGLGSAMAVALMILGLSKTSAKTIYLGSHGDRRSVPTQSVPTQSVPTTAAADCDQAASYRLYFVGDSHANHFRQTYDYACRSHDVDVKVSSVAGMPYPPISYANPFTGQNQEANWYARRAMEARWESLPPPVAGHGVVVISLRAGFYFDSAPSQSHLYEQTKTFSMVTAEPISKAAALADWINDLSSLASTHPTTNFVVLLPTPDFHDAYPIEICSPQWFRHPAVISRCNSAKLRKKEVAFVSLFQQQIRKAMIRHRNLFVFNAFSALCPSDQAYCPRFRNGMPLYSDQDHLSLEGANLVMDQLIPFLRQQKLLKS